MHVRIGIQPELREESVFIGMFHGHLFLNLTPLARAATHALGSSADQMCRSVCGRPLTEVEIVTEPPPPLARRLRNGARYAAYVLSVGKARAQLDQQVRNFRIDPRASALSAWQQLDEKRVEIARAMDSHLVSSAGAGPGPEPTPRATRPVRTARSGSFRWRRR